MKVEINENTKIKDLIPEGYEINYNDTVFGIGVCGGSKSCKITVAIKEKQNKFQNYLHECITERKDAVPPFDILKFICKKENVDLIGIIQILSHKYANIPIYEEVFRDKSLLVASIFPETFIKALFE